jgi:hypothetical protein
MSGTFTSGRRVDKRRPGRRVPSVTVTPQDRFIEANRLRHHLLEWSDAGPTVLLHGFLEHAHA